MDDPAIVGFLGVFVGAIIGGVVNLLVAKSTAREQRVLEKQRYMGNIISEFVRSYSEMVHLSIIFDQHPNAPGVVDQLVAAQTRCIGLINATGHKELRKKMDAELKKTREGKDGINDISKVLVGLLNEFGDVMSF